MIVIQVRINVYTCGVNASDILICNGQYGVDQKMPFVPGFEVCGEVKEIGPKVKNFNVGDRVIGLKKDDFAGFAEECVILEQDLWGVPQAMTFEIGASLLDTYGTALLGLHRRAEVEADDTVLVTAAAGGLGLAAVDLAANVYKAKVLLHYNKLITCMQFSLVEFHDSNRSLEFVEQRIRHRWSAIKALLRL